LLIIGFVVSVSDATSLAGPGAFSFDKNEIAAVV
jgi:hypothetical protein